MKNKKGFTIIEIIICISLLVIIGVGSFISIRVVNNKIKNDKLEKIQDRIMNAVEVYIDNNKTVKNQLYDNRNGVVIPLNTLQNEGLIDLKGIINKKDDDYVVAVLGNEKPGECISPYIKGSWQINSSTSPIYICTNSDGSGSNLATIDPTKYGNKVNVSNQPYYFKGMEPHNYVKGGARILYVDSDDTIVLVNSYFNKIYITSSNGEEISITGKRLAENEIYNTIDEETSIDITYDSAYAISRGGYIDIGIYRKSYLGVISFYLKCDGYSCRDSINLSYEFYFRLDNKCKISSGTGSSINPYVIDC